MAAKKGNSDKFTSKGSDFVITGRKVQIVKPKKSSSGKKK